VPRSNKLLSVYIAATRPSSTSRRGFSTRTVPLGRVFRRAKSRLQSVSFDVDRRVTAYPADDYDRRGPWMHAAIDRMRFSRYRIEQTELILAPVLDDEHRATIRMSIELVGVSM